MDPGRDHVAGGEAGLELASAPTRRQVEQLQSRLAARRDEIAALDEELEQLRATLTDFEAYYHVRLAEPEDRLRRLDGLVRHLERWIELLRAAPRGQVPQQGARLDQRRAQEAADLFAGRRQREEAAEDGPRAAGRAPPSSAAGAAGGTGAAGGSGAARPPRGEDPAALKRAYRALVRRFHPDLAESEEDRLRFGALMHRIISLYRDGDVARLQALAERTADPEQELADLPLPDRICRLEQRLAWFAVVRQNLEDERAELEACDLYRLWRRAEDARARGQDLFATLAAEMQERLGRRRADVAWAYRELEEAVKRFNREDPAPPAVAQGPGQREALERLFDPLEDRPLVRLGLETLEAAAVRPAARRQARWVESLAQTRPALLHLLLFTHVDELSHLPLPGLETYEDLRIRFESAAALAVRDAAGSGDTATVPPKPGDAATVPPEPGDGPTDTPEPDDGTPPSAEAGPEAEAADDPAAAPGRPSLEETLAEAADLVEYGVQRATAQLVYLGLRFRSDSTREGLPLALQAAPVRRAFRQVLQVLGEQVVCRGCGRDTFTLPLYLTRGLDDLRATVCPRCGRVHQRYYLPKGDDLQAVLNRAYVDLELVAEWALRLGRVTVSTQLLPVELYRMTVGDLKARLVKELLQRYELGITRGQLELHQRGRRVPERTPLSALAERRFTVRLRAGAPVDESTAVELLRHRIRNRFR